MDERRVGLRAITADNFDAVIALRVADDQVHFLNSNVESIAWAYVAAECRPFVIYEGDDPVGLATYGYLPADGRCWIIHLMVDESRQRRGLGRAALEQLLARMSDESAGASLLVTVDPDNQGARQLYECFEFQDTGKRQNGELVLRRPGSRDEQRSAGRADAGPDRNSFRSVPGPLSSAFRTPIRD